MFGMDMGMGAMDMGIGAMDMQIGAMDMGMGNPMLGADMMAMGGMDMGIGAMDMGMGMGMMNGGMMGMGGMGMGIGLGAMEMGMMGGGIGICPPGCMRACCRPVVVCPPGCMGPCCINKRVIVRNVPINQYNNGGFVQLPPIPPYQPRPQQPQQTQYVKTPGNRDIQQQMLNEQARIQNEKRQQILYKQKLQQEQLQLQKQKLQFEQQQLEQKRSQQVRMQQLQEQQRQKVKLEQQDRIPLEFKETFVPDVQAQQQKNPYEQIDEVLMQGCIYQQNFDQWQQMNARLTVRAFLGFNIENINKIKIKLASHVPNTRIIKISVNGRGDVFIAVPTQDHAQWMCRLIWARLNRIGRPCNQNQNFAGSFQGEILRKSFFNGWEVKFASISPKGLMISNNGGSVTHTITSVPQIWTRFDFIHGNMLIVKMHANGRKSEIGIPIQHAMVWLRGLYTLIRPS